MLIYSLAILYFYSSLLCRQIKIIIKIKRKKVPCSEICINIIKNEAYENITTFKYSLLYGFTEQFFHRGENYTNSNLENEVEENIMMSGFVHKIFKGFIEKPIIIESKNCIT